MSLRRARYRFGKAASLFSLRRVAPALLVGLMLCQLPGCGEYEPTADELSVAMSIREMGGRVTERGKMHVEVYLNGTKISDGDLPMLEEFPHLELLNLQDTGITDEGMRHIGKLKNLKRLTLQHSKVTDAGLEHLIGMTSLEELDLVGLPITDLGLEPLHGLINLKKLYFDPQRTSAEGVRRLRDALPDTKIFAD